MSPVPLEQALAAIDLVDVAVVIADRRNYVTCVLFPDFEFLEAHVSAPAMRS